MDPQVDIQLRIAAMQSAIAHAKSTDTTAQIVAAAQAIYNFLKGV